MSAPLKFDLLITPLLRGTNLLEASAGTGKTYAIAGLFVRLIVEEGLSVDQILAVTYTEAATAELRQRIRKALNDALRAFSGEPTAVAFLQHLVTTHAGKKAEIKTSLERALACFDQAAIYTIHAFCQRTLQDRAFESGVLFDVELVADQSAVLREIVEDYWRQNFYQQGQISLRFALKNKLSPEALLKFFLECVNHPFLKFESRVAGKSLKELQQAVEKCFLELRNEWKRESAAIKSLFGSSTNWSNGPYNSDEKMSECFRRLERCLNDPEAEIDILEALDCFCSKEMARKIAKKATSPAPAHRFFDLCEQMAEAEENFLAGARLDFAHYAQVELPKRKALRKVQSFDDLLMNVYRVLHGVGGPALAENLRATYKAALIDEFQDTDPVQYEIFRRTFTGGTTFLYLIGDPKQAIYAFRGADIFTYMQAAGAAERHYSLAENWRSEAKLVEAVNTVFDRPQNPFVFEEIEFSPVIAKADADKKPLTVDGRREPPFQIWLDETEGKSIAKGEAEKSLPGIVAGEIVRLLNGNARIGDRSLKAEDIAVLVPENKHAQLMQEALRALNVPSVLHTTGSLFASFETQELRRVLMAIERPTEERLLRAALVTELMGVSGMDLVGLSELEAQTILERFHQYLELWVDHGFFRMFREWMQQESVRRRLLAFPDGERRLTNLLHLGEVMHQAEGEFRFGASGLLQWLGEGMDPDADIQEEYQLRLERDDNAVRLITIHKSKGLQYGVVFCPFNWRDSDPQRGHAKEIFFHEPDDAGRLVCDLAGTQNEAHMQLAGRERLAENVRLMYVAITRAVHRCCFIWGKFTDAGSSSAAWLLHQKSLGTEPNLTELHERFNQLSPDEVRSQLNELADASGGAVEIRDLPAPDGQRHQLVDVAGEKLSCREFTGKIPRDWRISSFSGLTSAQAVELPDYDNVVTQVDDAEDATGIFAFPRGVRAGTCLHEILQQTDFARTDSAASIIEEKLRDYGLLSPEHALVVETMLENVTTTPLIPKRHDFTLSRVAGNERLTELEFYFPIRQLVFTKLQERLRSLSPHGLQPIRSERLTFDPINGFLKGFIDLVFRLDGKFYIIDWKSNWLGNRVEDYHASALRAEMERHQYFLQYHLYSVALYKYLTLRLPGYNFEKHFGGVFYVFLRGLDPTRPELGIFHDRPSYEMIQRLSEMLGNP